MSSMELFDFYLMRVAIMILVLMAGLWLGG